MIIVLLGSPGAGKTTIAKALARDYSLHHIQIGQIVRDRATEHSRKGELIDHLANKKGKLLPDALVYEFLLEEFSTYGVENVVIDGFPRNANQLKLLEEALAEKDTSVDSYIYLLAWEETAVQRVLARNMYGICLPKIDLEQNQIGVACEIVGEKEKREDSNPQAISSKIEEYHDQTQPVIATLRERDEFVEINAEQAIDKVYQEVIETIPTHIQPTAIQTADKKFQKLFVITHSQSDYNARKIFTGQSDVPLTELGIEKAKLLSEILRYEHIDVAYRTHLMRTEQTLEPFFEYHPDIEVVIEDRLLERDYGDLVGLSKEKFKEENPDLWPIYHRSYDVPPPGGESLKQVEARVLPALKEIIQRIQNEKINILIVAHSNAIRPIRRYFEKLTPEEMMKLDHQRHQIFTYNIPLNGEI